MRLEATDTAAGRDRRGRRRLPLVAAGIVAAAVALLAAGWLTAGPRSAVAWSALRAIAFESDDWGLAGFVPSAAAWEGLQRESLAPGRFPSVYWNSTLEDSASVASLAAVLAAGRGRDGGPAVLQPNYVLSSLAWEDGRWRRHDLPDLPEAYARPGLWNAVSAARDAGVWEPEFHAAWHYDPQRRRQATAGSREVLEAAARGIMLFPGSEAARELGPWRNRADLAAELDTSLTIFARAFGRAPQSLIAPDYTWDGRVEDLWATRGQSVIQAKREQRDPGLPGGLAGRGLKYLGRQWAQATHADRCYLERNCRLEPVQSPDAGAVVLACLAETRRAWARGEPAIVETHRINFAHADPAVPAAGRASLARYLSEIASPGREGPLFLTDGEIAALYRQGVSTRAVGSALLGRNGTHARRVVEVAPPGAAEKTSAGAAMRRLLILDAGYGTMAR